MRRRDALRSAGGLVGLAGIATLTSGRTNQSTATEPYGPLGRVSIDGASEAVVGDDGTTAYVAANTGFATVDVSVPDNPTVLAERRDLLDDREDGPLAGILDLKVEGDRLLVAGPAHRGVSEISGILVYDVADPADPQQIAFYSTTYYVHNCYLEDGIAYIPQGSANERLEIADVSTSEPETLTTWDPIDHDSAWSEVDGPYRNVHDVWVQGDRAYLAAWDAGTFVLDVADPGNPSFLARIGGSPLDELQTPSDGDHIQPPGNHHYVQASADHSLLVVGAEAWNVEDAEGGGPGAVHLWDISTLSEPQKLSTIEPLRARDETFSTGIWTTSHNFELSGGRLYTSWYQGGLKIHDVSDPANPEQLAAWRDHETAAFWTARSAANDVVVASATAAAPPLTEHYEGLYTFPDRAGEQTDPPTIPSPTPSPSPTSSPDETPDDRNSPTDTFTPTPTKTPSPSPTDTPTPTESPTPTPDPVTGDGFGALTGLTALLGAAWWRRRE